jgi:hypothetical protein
MAGGTASTSQVTRVAASPLRMLLCRCWLRAVLRGEGAEVGGPKVPPMGCSSYYDEDEDDMDDDDEDDEDDDGPSPSMGGLRPTPVSEGEGRPDGSSVVVSVGSGSEAGSGRQSPSVPRSCWACGVIEGEGIALKKCSGCRCALYCSGPCQVGHWKAHKAECRDWAAGKSSSRKQPLG